MNYPEGWLCKNCYRPFDMHVKKGSPVIGDEGKFNGENWCYSTEEANGTKKYYWTFYPMDNLTLIETLSKEKGL